jgi:ribosomal protein L5
MGEETADDKAQERTVERLSALLMTTRQNPQNYTSSRDAAGWIVKEAQRLGWSVTIEEKH